MRILRVGQNLETVETLETFDARELERAIRDAIIAEQGAIKQYEVLVDSTDNSQAKEVLQSIADEEKVHVGELLELLKRFNEKEEEFLADGADEVEPESK